MRHFADGRPAGRYFADGTPYIKPTPDPLFSASTADVLRQLGETRKLVREAVAIIEGAQMRILSWDQDEADDWLRRARSATR